MFQTTYFVGALFVVCAYEPMGTPDAEDFFYEIRECQYTDVSTPEEIRDYAYAQGAEVYPNGWVFRIYDVAYADPNITTEAQPADQSNTVMSFELNARYR